MTRREDVTEMARNLVESQQMAADTTGRIIDALLLQLEQAERRIADHERLRRTFDEALEAATRCNEIARDALAVWEQE